MEYAKKGLSDVGTIFIIEFTAASKGARVNWVSQYPYEDELLFPPCTYLTCTSSEYRSDIGLRCLKITANVSIYCQT